MFSAISKPNSGFKCSCNLPIGSCNNQDHPKKMEAVVGPFIEGWALGKYTKKVPPFQHLKYGQLVHDYKYVAPTLDDVSAIRMRTSTMKEINQAIEYFMKGYFRNTFAFFNTVVPLPSSTGKKFTIQQEIALSLNKVGFRNVSSAILVKEKGIEATKNINGFQKRLKSSRAKLELGETGDLIVANGILLIDDVYGTGATLRTAVQLLNKAVPLIPKYFLTVAYLD